MKEFHRNGPVPKQTYFLVAGEIVMQLSDDALPSTIRLNTVVMSNDERFAVDQIAKAQQALQFQFHKRSGEENPVKVLDVVILGIMNLGKFTSEEFNARPKGMDVREVPLNN